MGLPIIGTILEAGLKIIDKVIPDPQAKAQAQLELMKLQQQGEFKQLEVDLQLSLAQTNINQTEAASGNLFIGGWRPAIGWTCALGLFVTIFVYPLVQWVSALKGWPAPPKPEVAELMALLVPMLGLGGYRTIERLKGKA